MFGIIGDARVFSLLAKSRGQKGSREMQGAYLRHTLYRILGKLVTAFTCTCTCSYTICCFNSFVYMYNVCIITSNRERAREKEREGEREGGRKGGREGGRKCVKKDYMRVVLSIDAGRSDGEAGLLARDGDCLLAQTWLSHSATADSNPGLQG